MKGRVSFNRRARIAAKEERMGEEVRGHGTRCKCALCVELRHRRKAAAIALIRLGDMGWVWDPVGVATEIAEQWRRDRTALADSIQRNLESVTPAQLDQLIDELLD